jgi:hypothetical protein
MQYDHLHQRDVEQDLRLTKWMLTLLVSCGVSKTVVRHTQRVNQWSDWEPSCLGGTFDRVVFT